LASNSKIIGYIGMIGFYDLPNDYLKTFNARVNAVTVDQIKDAFKRRLSPDKFVTVMVGPVPDEKEPEKDRAAEPVVEDQGQKAKAGGGSS